MNLTVPQQISLSVDGIVYQLRIDERREWGCPIQCLQEAPNREWITIGYVRRRTGRHFSIYSARNTDPAYEPVVQALARKTGRKYEGRQ